MFVVVKKRIAANGVVKLCALGAFSGFINGIFGSGGGVAIVLSLWALAGEVLEDRRRVFANVTAIILPISLASSLVYLKLSPPTGESLWIGVSALVGGAVGAMLLGRLRLRVVKVIFAFILIVSGIVMIAG